MSTITQKDKIQYPILDARQVRTPIVANPQLVDSRLFCELGKYYRFDSPVDAISLYLPIVNDSSAVNTIVIYLTSAVDDSISILTAGDDAIKFQIGFGIKANTTYEINALYNGKNWVVAAVEMV